MSTASSSRERNTYAPIYLVTNNVAKTSDLWPGGQGVFMASMSGAGSVTLQYALPDANTAAMPPTESTTWVAVGTDTTLSANGGGVFNLPGKTRIRAVVAGVTAAYATVKQVD